MEQERSIPNCKVPNMMLPRLQRQITANHKNEGENLWVTMVEAVKVVAISGDNQRLFKLIHNTGGRRTPVNEIMCDRSREPVHGRQQGLDR